MKKVLHSVFNSICYCKLHILGIECCFLAVISVHSMTVANMRQIQIEYYKTTKQYHQKRAYQTEQMKANINFSLSLKVDINYCL